MALILHPATRALPLAARHPGYALISRMDVKN